MYFISLLIDHHNYILSNVDISSLILAQLSATESDADAVKVNQLITHTFKQVIRNDDIPKQDGTSCSINLNGAGGILLSFISLALTFYVFKKK